MCKKDANPNEKSSNNKSEEKIKFAEFLRLPGNRRPVTDCLR